MKLKKYIIQVDLQDPEDSEVVAQVLAPSSEDALIKFQDHLQIEFMNENDSVQHVADLATDASMEVIQ